MELLAQRYREWGYLLLLPPQTSNVAWVVPCRAPPEALLRKCERLPIALSQKEVAWKAVAQPHLPMALLAISNVNRRFGGHCRMSPAALLQNWKRLQIAIR